MKRILYHLPILPPQYPAAEALSQEIASLSKAFGGTINYINPNPSSPIYIPRLLFGFHQLRRLIQLEKQLDVHHLYNPDPFPFPLFRWLKKPVIYSLSSSVTAPKINRAYFQKMAAITVYDRQSQKRLQALGLNNVHVIQPGIESARFTPHPMPPKDGPLLVASAPWVKRHFAEKGIDVLLDTAVALPNLHLTFLWRGELVAEMQARINERHLQDRVKLINKVVDVNQVLEECRATINLATQAGVVKGYPHSLMDSLAASRPVILSQTLAMAADVRKYGVGIVVNEVTVAHLTAAVQKLEANYKTYWQAANRQGQTLYAIDRTLASYQHLYEAILGEK